MKVFRAAICAILSLILLAAPTAVARAPASTKAYAATDGRAYARADMRNIYFCKEMNADTALFALPYTYCVEILADHGEWLLVRYAQDDGLYSAVTGYCKSAELTVIDEPPQNVYLNYPVETTLRSGVPADSFLPGLEISVTAAYYGVYYKAAAAYSYVLYNGKFSYIAGAYEDYPLNEIPVEPTFNETPEEKNEGNARLITAIIITVLAAGVIVVLILTGKKRNPKTYSKTYNKQ